MKTGTGPERAGSLVVELAARTAIIDGRRIELPPTEFALLAVLAARPGEVVTHKELAAEAFGEGAAMAPHDLHWRIWKVRELVGDKEREDKLIENRRGQGYVLNLAKAAVDVLEGVFPLPVADEVRVVRDEVPESGGLKTGDPKVDSPPPLIAESPLLDSRTLRPRVVIAASLAAAVALSGSWFAGYVLSSRGAPQAETEAAREAGESDLSEVEPGKETDKEARRKGDRRRSGAKRRKGSDRQAGAAAVIAAPVPSTELPAANPVQPQGSQGSRQSSPKHPPEPALPAGPTRYLYHLEHPETGDHFVTTDDNIVSTYQGRGYVGGAIGRVYTSAPEGVTTKAINTNRGTAYIFSSASPKTEPASSTVPLYYSTNNDGDFFYTTSAGEARETGWEGVLIGYVRTLG